MKKVLLVLFSVVLLSFVFQACNLEAPAGSITILSVTPNSGLVAGVATDFTVEVEYSLSNTAQAELIVGFNTSEVDVFAIVMSEIVIISEGSGQHTFHATNIVPKDWGIAGDFRAYVNISEYPHDSPWTPLDIDTMVLTF
jgi:hypothetical protein